MPVTDVRSRARVPVERSDGSPGVRLCEEVPQASQIDLRQRRRPLLESLRASPIGLSH